MEILLGMLGGYLVGSISPSYFISRSKGFDIRERGTGNAGATNTMLAVGTRAGVLVMLIDVLKAFLAVFSARLLAPELPLCAVCTGIACVIGHIFPLYLGFRGGKGTACVCGLVLGLTPELVLPMLLGSFFMALLLNYASLIPLLVAASYPPLYLMRTGFSAGTAVLAILLPALLWSHRHNFSKIRNGEETPFRCFLFRRGTSNHEKHEEF